MVCVHTILRDDDRQFKMGLLGAYATAASQYDQRIGRINGFIQSDHASIGKNLGAASGESLAERQARETSNGKDKARGNKSPSR